jgi:hypothetical protein
MKGQLFEYAVLFHPKPTKDPAGNDTTPKSTMIVEPTRILAESEKEVSIKASRAISTDYDDKMELVEILVRPF